MFSVGDAISILDHLVPFVRGKINQDVHVDFTEVRKALCSLYFSEQMLRALESKNKSEFQYAAIRLRDTRDSVSAARQTLKSLSDDNKLSIRGRRELEEILVGKASLRTEIAEALWASSEEDAPKIVASIRKLNEQIEALDEKIGGGILTH